MRWNICQSQISANRVLFFTLQKIGKSDNAIFFPLQKDKLKLLTLVKFRLCFDAIAVCAGTGLLVLHYIFKEEYSHIRPFVIIGAETLKFEGIQNLSIVQF